MGSNKGNTLILSLHQNTKLYLIMDMSLVTVCDARGKFGMKLILCGVSAILLLYSATAATLPIKNCKEKSGATQSDIESLRNRKMPQTKTGRCFLECIFESVKILDNGKFNKKGMTVVFAPALAGDFSKLGKLKHLAEVCEKEIGTDPLSDCEGAEKVVKCVAGHVKETGITFPKARI